MDAPIPGITQKAVSTENYAEINVNGKQARVESRTPDGSLIERIDLK